MPSNKECARTQVKLPSLLPVRVGLVRVGLVRVGLVRVSRGIQLGPVLSVHIQFVATKTMDALKRSQ